MSRPLGSGHRLTHEPWVLPDTEYNSSTLNPLRTFIVAGSVAGGSLDWANTEELSARADRASVRRKWVMSGRPPRGQSTGLQYTGPRPENPGDPRWTFTARLPRGGSRWIMAGQVVRSRFPAVSDMA